MGRRLQLARNVETVIRVENEVLRPRSRSEAITDAIGGFVGTISFVVLQIVASAGWVIVNAGIISQPFDPFPYSLLFSITSLEAVLIAAFVLMKQNRMGIIADRRDHLDLQVRCWIASASIWASSSTMTIIAVGLGAMSLSSTWLKRFTAACPTSEVTARRKSRGCGASNV